MYSQQQSNACVSRDVFAAVSRQGACMAEVGGCGRVASVECDGVIADERVEFGQETVFKWWAGLFHLFVVALTFNFQVICVAAVVEVVLMGMAVARQFVETRDSIVERAVGRLAVEGLLGLLSGDVYGGEMSWAPAMVARVCVFVYTAVNCRDDGWARLVRRSLSTGRESRHVVAALLTRSAYVFVFSKYARSSSLVAAVAALVFVPAEMATVAACFEHAGGTGEWFVRMMVWYWCVFIQPIWPLTYIAILISFFFGERVSRRFGGGEARAVLAAASKAVASETVVDSFPVKIRRNSTLPLDAVGDSALEDVCAYTALNADASVVARVRRYALLGDRVASLYFVQDKLKQDVSVGFVSDAMTSVLTNHGFLLYYEKYLKSAFPDGTLLVERRAGTVVEALIGLAWSSSSFDEKVLLDLFREISLLLGRE